MRALILTLFVGSILTVAPAEAGTNFTLRALDGKYLRLSDYKKKVVYLTFWATWCKPCLAEMKHLNKFHARYKAKGLVVLGVNLDGPETRSRVRATVARYKLKFPIAIDTQSRAVKLYNPRRSLPFSVLIKKGKVIKKRASFQVSDLPEIEKEIKAALK